jgi:hypothetical protein
MARLEAAPESIAHELSGVLLRGLRDALRHAPMKESARRRLEEMKLIRKQQDRFSSLTPRGLEVLRAASVDRSPEGGDRETGRHAKHESAVGEAETPTTEGDS